LRPAHGRDRGDLDALEIALGIEELRAAGEHLERRLELGRARGEEPAQPALLLEAVGERARLADAVGEPGELARGDPVEHDRPGGVPAHRGRVAGANRRARGIELRPLPVPGAAPGEGDARHLPLLDRGEVLRLLLLAHRDDRPGARAGVALGVREDRAQGAGRGRGPAGPRGAGRRSRSLGHRGTPAPDPQASRCPSRAPGTRLSRMEAPAHAAVWRLLSLEVPVGEPPESIRLRACRELAIDPERLRSFRLVRKSLDARRRGGAHRLRSVVHVDLAVDARFASAALSRARKAGRVVPAPAPYEPRVERVHTSLPGARIVVVGAGPAGPLRGLDPGAARRRGHRPRPRLARRSPQPGARALPPQPVAGSRVEPALRRGRGGHVLGRQVYTRVDDPLEVPILEALVAAGAPEALLYDGRAHVGTDRLHKLLPALRASLEALGVRFAWNTRLERILRDPRAPERVRALATSAGELPCDALLLGVGHSARDTWSALAEQGVPFRAKPFQVGVRIEHPQELVDRAQHGTGPEAAALGAAYYQLVRKPAGACPARTASACARAGASSRA
jgi:hypothetical protein